MCKLTYIYSTVSTFSHRHIQHSHRQSGFTLAILFQRDPVLCHYTEYISADIRSEFTWRFLRLIFIAWVSHRSNTYSGLRRKLSLKAPFASRLHHNDTTDRSLTEKWTVPINQPVIAYCRYISVSIFLQPLSNKTLQEDNYKDNLGTHLGLLYILSSRGQL